MQRPITGVAGPHRADREQRRHHQCAPKRLDPKAKAENDGDIRTNSEIADDIYGVLLDYSNLTALEGHLAWLLCWLDDHEPESKGRMIVQAIAPDYCPTKD